MDAAPFERGAGGTCALEDRLGKESWGESPPVQQEGILLLRKHIRTEGENPTEGLANDFPVAPAQVAAADSSAERLPGATSQGHRHTPRMSRLIRPISLSL